LLRQVTDRGGIKIFSNIKNKVHADQESAYKIIKFLNERKIYKVHITDISETQWILYCKRQWFSRGSNNEPTEEGENVEVLRAGSR
jgi:hypothetical protein